MTCSVSYLCHRIPIPVSIFLKEVVIFSLENHYVFIYNGVFPNNNYLKFTLILTRAWKLQVSRLLGTYAHKRSLLIPCNVQLYMMYIHLYTSCFIMYYHLQSNPPLVHQPVIRFYPRLVLLIESI